jgi:hypothetical protein
MNYLNINLFFFFLSFFSKDLNKQEKIFSLEMEMVGRFIS